MNPRKWVLTGKNTKRILSTCNPVLSSSVELLFSSLVMLVPPHFNCCTVGLAVMHHQQSRWCICNLEPSASVPTLQRSVILSDPTRPLFCYNSTASRDPQYRNRSIPDTVCHYQHVGRSWYLHVIWPTEFRDAVVPQRFLVDSLSSAVTPSMYWLLSLIIICLRLCHRPNSIISRCHFLRMALERVVIQFPTGITLCPFWIP